MEAHSRLEHNDIDEDGDISQSRSSRVEMHKEAHSKISRKMENNTLEHPKVDPEQIDSACISNTSDAAFFSQEFDSHRQETSSINSATHSFHYASADERCIEISKSTKAHSCQQRDLTSKIVSLSLADKHDSDDEGVCLSSVTDEVQRSLISAHSNQQKCSNVNDRITSTALLVYGKDADGDTMLHIAIIQFCVDLVLRFIKIAPWFDWLDIYNDSLRQTPLHIGALTRQKSVVRKLMVGGANIEMRDHNGDTPLHIACKNGFFDIVQTLLEPISYGETAEVEYEVPYQRIPQNLELRNYDGYTCLHIAAEQNYINIMMHLLAKGADINSGDGKSGKTILHYAAENNNIQLVKTLLKQNEVLIDAKTYNGSTPLLIANGRKNSAIVDLLIQNGANTSCLEESYFSDSEDDDE